MTRRAPAGAEFPPPRFPAGVGVPPLVLLAALTLGALGLAAIHTAEPVVVLGGPAGRPGVVPAAALAALAVVAWLVLRLAVVRPVRRLRESVLVPGAEGRVRRSLIAEVDRIAVAVGGRRKRRSPRLPLTALLVALAVALLVPLAASYLAVSGTRLDDRPEVVAEAGTDVAQATGRLRSALVDGLATLQGLSGPTGGAPDAVAASALDARPVFRSVYVLDPAGRRVAGAGAPALRTGAAPPAAGISQANTDGSQPVILAATALYDGKVLVGEYDARALNRVLRDNGVRLRVADPGFRTVLSNRGYEAFTVVDDPQLRAAATAAAATGVAAPAAVRAVGGTDAAVAARTVAGAGEDPLAGLRWVLIGDRDLAGGQFLHDDGGRAALVVIALTTMAVLAVLVWLHIATVRPLRAAGRQAAALAAAQRGAALPTPMPAQRVDEIGGIAVGLNRILHALGADPDGTGALPLTGPEAAALITGDMISRAALDAAIEAAVRRRAAETATSAFARV